jgi:hypothetical protein
LTQDWECGTCDEWNQSYPGFDTTLNLRNVRNSQLHAVFRNAASEWNQIITGDLPSIQLPATAKQQSRFCTARSIPRVIDDILICVNVQAIDGPGRVLGQAGPEFIRTGSSIPLMGGMVFDEADVDFMVQQGIFDEVIVSCVVFLCSLKDLLYLRTEFLDCNTLHSASRDRTRGTFPKMNDFEPGVRYMCLSCFMHSSSFLLWS